MKAKPITNHKLIEMAAEIAKRLRAASDDKHGDSFWTDIEQEWHNCLLKN